MATRTINTASFGESKVCTKGGTSLSLRRAWKPLGHALRKLRDVSPARSMFLRAASALSIALASITAAAHGAEPPLVQPKGSPDVIQTTGATVGLTLVTGRSKLLRAPTEVRRIAVVDAGIAEVVQVSPRELMVLGKAVGKTDVTIWISGTTRQPVIMLVRVVSN